CDRTGGACISSTASAHGREQANRSTDTAKAPRKAVNDTVKGAETLCAYLYGSAEIVGPGAFTGACGSTESLREDRGERAGSRRSCRQALQRRDRPSDVRPSRRYDDIGNELLHAAHCFKDNPLRTKKMPYCRVWLARQ